MSEENNDIPSGDEFTPAERIRLRRMLQDDLYARRFKTTLKVWFTTLGTIMAVAVAIQQVWEKVITRLLLR
jgi:hypothetical protein